MSDSLYVSQLESETEDMAEEISRLKAENEALCALLQQARDAIPVWREGVPDKYGQYLVKRKDGSITIDEWAELREAPVSFSTKTISVGDGWLDHDIDEIAGFMPLPPTEDE